MILPYMQSHPASTMSVSRMPGVSARRAPIFLCSAGPRTGSMRRSAEMMTLGFQSAVTSGAHLSS